MSKDGLRRCAARCLAVACGLGALAEPAHAGNAAGDLARKYAPVVRLVEQKEPCGHGEPYVPTNVNLVLGSPYVALRGPWDRTNIITVGPTARDLSRGLFDYHLDFPGTATYPGCTYDRWSHLINRGHSPMTYAHIVKEAAHPGQLAVQYWFFYVFNDFNDKHEGDWEMIQLDFDTATPEEALQTTPALVGFSQHEGAESAHWGDSKLKIVDGTHPVVYSALGSHANYFTSAVHLGRSAAQGVGCDDTEGPSTQLRPDVALIPTGAAAYLHAYPWLGYKGRWGEQHRGFYNGPTGPTTKLQWTQPLTWAGTKWHDKSFTVPAGTALGTTATGFFCGAFAAGSDILTTIVGNPSPLLIALAVLLVLILWLGSRTQWHPSAPLHLERRRPWGAILIASRRLYFGNLGLFLSIGLLFFPLGVLITAVQYLVFRLVGLNGLVSSAGSTNAFVAFLATGLGVLFTIFGLAVVMGVTAIAMTELDAGREPRALDAYRRVLPRTGMLLGVVLIAAVVNGIFGLTGIGLIIAIWLSVRWSFLAQVVVLEDVPGLGALHRSARLVRQGWLRVASMLLLVTVIALLLGPLVGTLMLFVTDASFDFINLIASVIYAVVLPFAAIATTYLYFDLRVADKLAASTAEEGDVLPAEVAS